MLEAREGYRVHTEPHKDGGTVCLVDFDGLEKQAGFVSFPPNEDRPELWAMSVATSSGRRFDFGAPTEEILWSEAQAWCDMVAQHQRNYQHNRKVLLMSFGVAAFTVFIVSFVMWVTGVKII